MRPVNQWVGNFVTHHTTTEWLVGMAIILTWAVVAFASISPIAALTAVMFAVILHYIAMETGNHVWLWLATAVMLLFVIVAYSTVLQPLGPVVLAVGGAMTLAYNEAIRLNYFRRRRAVVDPGVFVGSIIATAVAAVVGVAGIAVSVLLSAGVGRSWVWMPAAVVTLMTVAYAAALLPARQAPRSSSQRWEPGTRIPPQPLAGGNGSTTPGTA
ncbi:MAG: M48 family metallopeptidase, partial [Acidimicrobiia bacterium]|nr:M48 family metallopeptidase [Acidimicrobiia bacterium]